MDGCRTNASAWRTGAGLLAVLVLVTAGCGFTLRGSVPLVAGVTALRLAPGGASPPLQAELAAALEQRGLLTEDPQAPALVLGEESFRRDILSYTERARVSELSLHHEVSFTITAADGTVLKPPRRLVAEREYGFDETQALGATQEEALIARELRRELVLRILDQLRAPVSR